MPARLPSLRNLLAFEAAARLGAFWEAARELNLTDSAVSHAVRALEQQLGRKLFRREARGVVLTEVGRELYARVAAALSQLNEALDLGDEREPVRLTILCDAAFASRFLATRLHAFCEARPKIAVELRTSAEPQTASPSSADVVIFESRGDWRGQGAHELCPIVLVPLANPGYATSLAARPPLALIGGPSGAAGGGVADHARQLRLRVDDYAASLSMAVAGVGVALAPQLLALEDLRAGRLVRLEGATQQTGRAYWVKILASASKGVIAQAFCDWLRAEAEDGAGLGAPPTAMHG